MILSPYRNPPYRAPTPQQGSSTVHSPKRKRNDAPQAPPPPQTSSTNEQSQDEQIAGAVTSSPRLQVADQFKDLNIQRDLIVLPGKQRQIAKRKRLKRNPALANFVEGDNVWVAQTPEHAKNDLNGEPGLSHEVEETPDCRVRVQSSPLRSLAISDEPAKSTEDDEALENWLTQLPRTPLPFQSIAPDPTTLATEEADLVERSLSPLPLREDLSPDLAALTWQEDEITGHDVDPESGDDGEGINGIGFKPTPAIAYARRQKRKQQVNEWKAREAREARQKRIERRRGGEASVPTIRHDNGSDGDVRRIVRFAGVG